MPDKCVLLLSYIPSLALVIFKIRASIYAQASLVMIILFALPWVAEMRGAHTHHHDLPFVEIRGASHEFL
jgi:hypothetical protein